MNIVRICVEMPAKRVPHCRTGLCAIVRKAASTRSGREATAIEIAVILALDPGVARRAGWRCEFLHRRSAIEIFLPTQSAHVPHGVIVTVPCANRSRYPLDFAKKFRAAPDRPSEAVKYPFHSC